LPKAEIVLNQEEKMRKILISACLYGDVVRYDGKQILLEDPLLLKWKEEGRLIPFCPEVYGGLEVPRSDCQILGDRVLNRIGEDVTAAFQMGATEAVRLAKVHEVAFAIMKERSPSCGSSIVYDGSFSGLKISGQGIATRELRKDGVLVISENELFKGEARLKNQE
jgi:uncharacterized protein YbbK (DUF523 family)